jgi:hypothetical protein
VEARYVNGLMGGIDLDVTWEIGQGRDKQIDNRCRLVRQVATGGRAATR